MRNYLSRSVFTRSAWFAIAVFLVVFCGPVKRMIELRQNGGIASSSQTIDNRLRTGYREKLDIAQVVQFVSHPSPDTGLTFLLVASFLIALSLIKKGVYFKPQYDPAAIAQALPLYLRIRKLQV